MTVRLAEVLTALSLASDVGHDQPLEKSLRNAVIAVRLGEELTLRGAELSAVYYVALLRSIGCTANAPETAMLFGGDDVGVRPVVQLLAGGEPRAFVRALVRHASTLDPRLSAVRNEQWWFSTEGRQAIRLARDSACEVSVALARRLGLSLSVQEGLDHAYERWDAKGAAGIGGEELSLAARVAHVADIVEIAARAGGVSAAIDIVRERAGSHFDPAISAVFAASADELLVDLEATDMLVAALAAEPTPRPCCEHADLPEFARAIADFVDIKSPWTLGHSRAVAELARDAAAPDDAETLLLAGLLHDLGRVAVPNGIWDHAGPLGPAQWERVRLHAYYTERILARAPAFEHLAVLAGSHHERLDGSGYHRGADRRTLSVPARLLAAADAYVAMRAARPQRLALGADQAAAELQEAVASGTLCADAVARVLSAAGHSRSPALPAPAGLSERETEVLALLARGLTNKQIAAELVLSARTVQHHVAHIYDKIDRRTRAGAAMFAVEHRIIAAQPEP